MFKQYLQQYKLTCVEASMGLTLCCINLASLYPIDSTSLCFIGLDTKPEVPVLLLTDRKSYQTSNG